MIPTHPVTKKESRAQAGHTGLPGQLPPPEPKPLGPPLFRRLFHVPKAQRDARTPAKDERKVTLQAVVPGAVVEASDRSYLVHPSGALRVVGKPHGTKKQRRAARAARKAGA